MTGRYLVRSRLRNAARLLADEDRSISSIALDVGFADHRLSSAFRELSNGDRTLATQRLSKARRPYESDS